MNDENLTIALAISTAVFIIYSIIQGTRLSRAKADLRKADLANEGLLETLSKAKDAAADDKRKLKADVTDLHRRYSALQQQGLLLASAPTRIQHDISGRLTSIANLVRQSALDTNLKTTLVRDMVLVSEKIELHLQPDISAYVKAKSEAGASGKVTADNVDLWKVVEGINMVDKYDDVRLEASEKIMLTGSWVHWDLMLSNIIANAVEAATQQRGSVTISARKSDSRLYIDIVNEGEHVPENMREKVFDWGVTTKKPTVNPLTGNIMLRGNGLYIAQQIAIGLGGRILPPENLTIRKTLFGKKRRAVRFSIVDLKLL